MEDNKNMSTNGQSPELGSDTIVFRRQPSPKAPPASDMQNTAKLQGGAVIRPLKSQSRVSPMESVQKKSDQPKLTPMQEAQRRQQLLREQQMTQKPTPRQSVPGQTTPSAPISSMPSAPSRLPNVQTQPQNSAPRPSDRPLVTTQTPLRTEPKPVSPTSIRPLQSSQPRNAAGNVQQNRPIPPRPPQNTSLQNSKVRAVQPSQNTPRPPVTPDELQHLPPIIPWRVTEVLIRIMCPLYRRSQVHEAKNRISKLTR